MLNFLVSKCFQRKFWPDSDIYSGKGKTGTFKIDRAKMPKAIEELATELLMIEAKGDYKGAVKFVKKYREMPSDLKAALAKLNAVPVDIRPIYSYR